jgi:integrase
VYDPFTKEQVYCVGSWHMMYPNDLHDRGTYTPACTSCLNAQHQLTEAAIRQGLKGSCDKHAHAPRLVRTGDVTEDLRVKLELAKWRVATKKGHTRRGNYALSPSEFRLIRTYLLSTNDPENFKLYTMMLLGVKFFLRLNELLSMTVEDFCSKMFQIDHKGVHTLAAWVKGKSDAKPVLLNTYADLHSDYKMDLVLHLMVYLKSTGIRSGILFPDASPGAATGTQMPYKNYLARLKFLFINILGKSPATVCMGTHTLCKTAYLFRVYAMLHQFASLVMEKGKYSSLLCWLLFCVL